jgi:hypothetical protein
MHQRALSIALLGSTMVWMSVFLQKTDGGQDLAARMLKPIQSNEVPWVFLTQEDITTGITIPANTNVVFTLPSVLAPSVYEHREILFGGQGKTVRYWGYCFPKSGLGKIDMNKQGLPGDIFLSEAERAARETAAKTTTRFNLFLAPKDSAKTVPQSSLIRHQREFFKPGETCYIMTAKNLSAGIDTDGDQLNTRLEVSYHTDPESTDTDGDGIMDGVEVLRGHTNPLIVDSDGDQLPDGTEDKDYDGRVDVGETNPMNPDSDGDYLCDGYCKLGLKNYSVCPTSEEGGNCVEVSPQYYMYKPDPEDEESIAIQEDVWYAGEDQNLNGVVDDGETDPLKQATYDGVLDFQRYLECVLSSGGEIGSC